MCYGHVDVDLMAHFYLVSSITLFTLYNQQCNIFMGEGG